MAFFPKEVEDRLNGHDEQLADIAINAKLPPIPLVGVKGDGITDDTSAFQNLINYAIENHKHIFIPEGNYVISDTLTFNYTYGAYSPYDNGFVFCGNVATKTVFLAKMTNKPLFNFATQNYGGTAYGIKIGNFVIKAFDNTYKFNFDCIKLINCVSNILENIELSDYRDGITLYADKDTSTNSLNTGYVEQNLFQKITLGVGINPIVYDVSPTSDYASSFHGNQWKECFIALNSDTTGVESTAIRMNAGLIYNNRFDIRIMTAGTNCNLLYINANGHENVGTITYECTNPARIKTGNRVQGKFVLDGFFVGLNGTQNIDWSQYAQVSSGDLDNSGVAIDSSSSYIGLDRFYSLNLIPPCSTLANALTGKTAMLESVNPNIQDVWNGIRQHAFYRYKATDYTNESGFVAICREYLNSGSAKFIVGLQPEVSKAENAFVPGFEIFASGKKINSKSQGTALNFTTNGIGTSGNTINIAQNTTPASSTDTIGVKGDIRWDWNYLYIKANDTTWRRIAWTSF